MDRPSNSSTKSHMPTESKTINHRYQHVWTSDEALSKLRLKINRYINEQEGDQTRHKNGNIRTEENIKKNLKTFERQLK
ncbi:hypothetical protein C922_02703 [Plasmodium inui San Antonio 1]|uniref:Uncharacterized protein n=1 Tax=Plasmodium inui San Antonio 1 TaxID=1237626 RepID=W7A683_9APIC|nr:hypothetical protein C922_02703 [Plasmodium inui San Antonio 1]EUD66718.1 hypothetical protein C922_02703 [Plasmodium inui San Antonio 1]